MKSLDHRNQNALSSTLPQPIMNASRDDITLFSSWVKYQHYIQISNPNAPRILSSQEVALAAELGKNFNFTNVYRQRLELEPDFYVKVRQNLMAILQLWDAVIDEKKMFDSGTTTLDPDVQKAFIFCTDVIPGRVDIGSLGTHALPNYGPAAPLALKTYTANLGSLYTNDNSFANATELAKEGQPSNQPYAEALALSDPEDTQVIGMENKEKTDSGEDFEDKCMDDGSSNEDEGSDDDYENIHNESRGRGRYAPNKLPTPKY